MVKDFAGRYDAILAQRMDNHRGLASFAVALICRTLPPLRPDVPERHLDLRAVDFALPGNGLQRFDIPARAVEDEGLRVDFCEGLAPSDRDDPLCALREPGVCVAASPSMILICRLAT